MYGIRKAVKKMNDLISRKAVIDIIHKEIGRTSTFAEHETQINIEMAVKELPTAYDVEKVVAELENMTTVCGAGTIINGGYIGRNRAIDIVRKGGIE